MVLYTFIKSLVHFFSSSIFPSWAIMLNVRKIYILKNDEEKNIFLANENGAN